MNRIRKLKRFSFASSGILLCTFAISWFFLFSGKEVITNTFNTLGQDYISSTMEEQNSLVYIYHSHNTESFIPETNANDPSEAFHETKNITMVGKRLSEALNEKGITSVYDNTNIEGILMERDLSFNHSYIVSREVLKESLDKNKSIKMVFDLHRDSQKRNETTININRKDYARIVLNVSRKSDNYGKNKEFAELIHEKLEESFPGLSRGVIIKGVDHENTYNQDLQDNSVLLEIGGVENTLEETYRSVDVFAEIVKEIIENKEMES